MISGWLVDCCPQRFSFRYICRLPMCYFHVCIFFLICTDAMHWIRVVISMVLFCCFCFSFTQRLTCILTCWMVHGIFDDLMLGLLDLCSVCQIFSIRFYTVIFSSIRISWQLHQSIGWLIEQSVDVWLIGWSTNRSIGSFIDWLVVGWEAIVFHSFGLAYCFLLFHPANSIKVIFLTKKGNKSFMKFFFKTKRKKKVTLDKVFTFFLEWRMRFLC